MSTESIEKIRKIIDELINNYPEIVRYISGLKSMKKNKDLDISDFTSINAKAASWANNIGFGWSYIINYCYQSNLKEVKDILPDYDHIDGKHYYKAESKFRENMDIAITGAINVVSKPNLLEDSLPNVKLHDNLRELFEHNTGLRKFATHHRHSGGLDYDPSNKELWIDFFNFTHVSDKLFDITIALVDILLRISSSSEDFEQKFSEHKDKLLLARETKVRDSLLKYRKRLENLIWGPEQYYRDNLFIKKARKAVEKYTIVAFWGIGGVGKTALAQKLLSDFITADDQKFTHIVTHSSKVGSDQKEINTLSEENMYRSTTGEVSIMESSLKDNSVLGGFKFLLEKIYMELMGSDGSSISKERLKRVILSELQQDDNRVLIVIDNFEDIEDHSDDPNIFALRDEYENFFNDLSLLDNCGSRVIITTRTQSPNYAFGVNVQQLNPAEAAELFLKKLLFRANSDNIVKELEHKLRDAYLTIRNNKQQLDTIIEKIGIWASGEDTAGAHPMLILRAAQSIEESNFEHIIEKISEWGEGSKNRDEIVAYCVSKTLGIFTPIEVSLLRVMAWKTLNSSSLEHKIIKSLFDNLTDENLPENLGVDLEFFSELKEWSVTKFHNFIIKLLNGSFIESRPYNIGSSTPQFIWNTITYDYLRKEFNSSEIGNYAPSKKEIISYDEEIVKDLNKWHDGNLEKTLNSIIDRIKISQKRIFRQINLIENRNTGDVDLNNFWEIYKEELSLVNKTIEWAFTEIKNDTKLSQLTQQPVKGTDVIAKIIEVQTNHIKIALLMASLMPRSKLVYDSIGFADIVGANFKKFEGEHFFDENQLFDLNNKLIDCYTFMIETIDINLSQSGQEKLITMCFNYLLNAAVFINPSDCNLINGLKIDDNNFELCRKWIMLHDNLRQKYLSIILEITQSLDTQIRGYRFWLLIRLISTDKNIIEDLGITIESLQRTLQYGLIVCNKPTHIIEQYLRSLRPSFRIITFSKPEDVVERIKNFKIQPSRGIMLFCPLSYESLYGTFRYEFFHNKNEMWMVEVQKPSAWPSDFKKEYKKVLIVLNEFQPQKLICRFDLDENHEAQTSTGNFQYSDDLIKQRENDIEKLIQENKFQNIITVREIINIFDDAMNFKEVIMFCQKFTKLTFMESFFIIDRSKKYAHPSAKYESLDGSKYILTSPQQRKETGVSLPKDPYLLVKLINECYMMKTPFKLVDYQNRIRSTFGNIPHCSEFFRTALGLDVRRQEWWDIELSEEIKHTKKKFLEYVKKSVLDKCTHIRSKLEINIPKTVIKAYFEEVELFIEE